MSNLSQTAGTAPVAAAQPMAPKQSELGRIVRLLSRFLVGQRRSFILAAIMLVIEALTAVLAPLLLFKYFIDGYLFPRINQLAGQATVEPINPLHAIGLPTISTVDIDTVVIITIGFILLTTINSLADSMSEIFLERSGRMLGFNMRVALYSHLQKLSVAFHNQKRTGDVLTRVTSDVSAIEEFVIGSLSDSVGSVLVIIFTLYVMLTNAWQVAVVAVLVIPIMAFISNHFAQRIKQASKQQRACEGELASSAQEMLSSIRVIQSFGRGGYELKRFAEQNQKSLMAFLEARRIRSTFSSITSVLEAVAVVLTIWLAVWLIFGDVTGAIGVGLLATFIKYIQDMFIPTKKIIREWHTVGKIYASVDRVSDLLDRAPAVEDAPNAIQAPHFKGDIQFRNVSFAYQSEPEAGQTSASTRLALHDLNLHISAGEVVALVGSSGAGKSTIIQLLPRLYDPHQGQVLVDGHDIREYILDTLRAQMSLVLQDTILFAGTVAENIAYGRPEAIREEIIAAAIQASAHEFIQKLPNGYETVLGERAANLSGGQRQRIAIARAFIRNSPILVLDEPTTGLDAESTELVLLALRTLMKGKSTLIVSHDLNLIRYVDKIVVLHAGEVAEVGTHKELLRLGGVYANLYSKQFGDAEAQAAQAEAAALLASFQAEIDEDDEATNSKIFQALVMQVVPQPVSSGVFKTLMTQAIVRRSQPNLAQVVAPDQEPSIQPPAAPAVATTVAEPPSANHLPLSERAVNGDAQWQPLPQMPKPVPQPPDKVKTTVVIPSQSLTPASSSDPRTTARIPDLTDAFRAVTAAADKHLVGAQIDPLSSETLARELPTLKTALDGASMRDQLQAVLFGRTKAAYTIERCEPGDASYLDGAGCVLHYHLTVRRNDSGGIIRPVIIGRVFRDQIMGAMYMRDQLMPIASLMRGRPELAPYTTPVAMIEPLTMVIQVFPIDGDLTMLSVATDRSQMVGVFNEMLPDAQAETFRAQDCKIEVANYTRHHRCVLRYVVGGKDANGIHQRRVLYGRLSIDNQTAAVAPVLAALQKRLATMNGAARFRIPEFYGFRPDLQLALLEGLPGTPQIDQLLRARMNDEPTNGGLTLEETLQAAGRIAATLHATDLRLGSPRPLEAILSDLRRKLRPVQRISPELGAHLDSLLLRIEAYAAESDSLSLSFCHGDYTYSQILFDGHEPSVVDFEHACQAEPAFDLGHFIACLRIAVRKGPTANTDLANQLGERFLQAYMTAAHISDGHKDWLRARIAVYQVVSLVGMATKHWMQLKGARLETVLSVIEEQMACLPHLE